MFDYISFIENAFPNIIFNHVIKLLVDDEIPFEHEFFMRISRSFPLLKILIISNLTPQSRISNKLTSNDNELNSTIIEYPYLTWLNLAFVHSDYIDQFLNDEKAHVPRLTKLAVNYYDLQMVTKNFTNDRTRFNCMKVKQLNIGSNISPQSENFHVYFPSL
jgi:hypothetical protein